MNSKEYILCAAIHVDDGGVHVHQPKNIHTGYVVCGWRHHNCYTTISQIGKDEHRKSHTQGFLTSKDRFLDRKEAADLANQCEQIQEYTNTLFSEDLY